MNSQMDIKSFTETNIPKKFQPDLSNSPLDNNIKIQLSKKLKQMHCQECICKGYKVCIALIESEFSRVSVSDNISLLSARGNNYEEIIQNLDIETSIPLDSYPNLIINIILSDKTENSESVSKICSLFQYYDTFVGLCIDSKSTDKYKIDIIAYK